LVVLLLLKSGRAPYTAKYSTTEKRPYRLRALRASLE